MLQLGSFRSTFLTFYFALIIHTHASFSSHPHIFMNVYILFLIFLVLGCGGFGETGSGGGNQTVYGKIRLFPVIHTLC